MAPTWSAGLQLFSICLLLYTLCVPVTVCLHLTGTWNGLNFFKFLTRFGFQQTNMHDLVETQGYIYGNVTLADESNATRRIMLVVVDSEYFLHFFGNRSYKKHSDSCASMFTAIDTIAWDEDCHPNGKQDFLRRVPCNKHTVCDEETDPKQVFPEYQLTFNVRDPSQPRYWYVSLVSCYRDPTTCKWSYDSVLSNVTISYDIWLVNGHPKKQKDNLLEHQFSFELHDILDLYAAFFIAYVFLLPVQLYALSIQRHSLPFLLLCCMVLEFVGVVLNVVHFTKFTFDGSGVPSMRIVGNFFDMAAQCLFMLLLLLLVKGWMITHRRLPCETKLTLLSLWVAYSGANVALFAWNQIEVDLISDIDEWQTAPGALILAFRLFIMLWFLWELRGTFMLERDVKKTKFYLHFGAGFLVWFVYLPLVNVVCTFVSSLWRYKTIISVSYSADFLSLCIMVHLLWPSKTYLYFNLDRLKTSVDLDAIDFPAMRLLQVGSSSSDESDDVYDAEAIRTTRLSIRPNRTTEESAGAKSKDVKHYGRPVRQLPND